MSKREKGSASTISTERPATTPEAREKQMISLAVNLAEQKLRDGTASNSLILHYLKLGSEENRLGMEILAEQKKLITAKTEALESQKNYGEKFEQAINAMKSYRGEPSNDEEECY